MRFLIIGIFLLNMFVFPSLAWSRRSEKELYPYNKDVEAEWIRNGEPISFEGEMWYPKDTVETLLDSEVILLGEYRDVQFFVDKIDIRPFARLYTKFHEKRFRVFQRLKK